MKTQVVMDSSGDTRHEFDESDLASIAQADIRFQQLVAQGYSAIAFAGTGEPGRLIKDFDSKVEKTVFVPRLVGG